VGVERQPVEWVDWVVLRFSEDMPVEYRPPDLDGLWMRKDEVPSAPSIEAARQAAESHQNEHLVGEAVAMPTDRFETRVVPHRVPYTDAEGYPVGLINEETQIAQVYEIRPLWKVDESW
jgi:hypothetical protein